MLVEVNLDSSAAFLDFLSTCFANFARITEGETGERAIRTRARKQLPSTTHSEKRRCEQNNMNRLLTSSTSSRHPHSSSDATLATASKSSGAQLTFFFLLPCPPSSPSPASSAALRFSDPLLGFKALSQVEARFFDG